MKFSIGDKVRFVNENMEGIISSIMDNNTVGVTVDNDFEIPVLMNEVIKIDFNEFVKSEANTAAVVPKSAENGFDENMYASFVQLNEQQMQLYFINHTPNRLFVNYYTKKNEIVTAKFFNTVEAFDYKSIDTLAMSEFIDWEEFHFQILTKVENKEVQPIIKNLQIPASRFFKHLRATPLLKKQGYLFLINEALNQTDIQKLTQYNPERELEKESPLRIKAPLEIIDLHIDKIHTNYTQLTKQETLQIQLNYFQKNLEDAIAANLKKVTFIHGVGNLKLKNEIVKLMKSNVNIIKIDEAPTSAYGYGATDVFLSVS